MATVPLTKLFRVQFTQLRKVQTLITVVYHACTLITTGFYFYRCQEVFLKSMRATIEATGQNIAHNEALRENVMMMVVCISVRIPLFLIGKPGSSKSLAKTIIGNSMKGIASSNEFLRNFKEVRLYTSNDILF